MAESDTPEWMKRIRKEMESTELEEKLKKGGKVIPPMGKKKGNPYGIDKLPDLGDRRVYRGDPEDYKDEN